MVLYAKITVTCHLKTDFYLLLQQLDRADLDPDWRRNRTISHSSHGSGTSSKHSSSTHKFDHQRADQDQNWRNHKNHHRGTAPKTGTATEGLSWRNVVVVGSSEQNGFASPAATPSTNTNSAANTKSANTNSSPSK